MEKELDTMSFALKLEKDKYIKMHLSILNLFLPKKLTEKEIDILSNFMSLPDELISQDMFNSYSRKLVKERLSLSSGGLGNHLKSMVDKGFLEKDKITARITVKKFLIPRKEEQKFSINIKVKKDEN